MTPSEIADWHDGAAAWMESREDFHIQAAATIRELEAKLKIATEALEFYAECDMYTEIDRNTMLGDDDGRTAAQALASIKETK